MHHGTILFLILLCFSVSSFASTGDEEPNFLSCVNLCSHSQCPTKLPLQLQLFFWSCKENCQYECMHAITDKAIEHGEKVLQYYGKWPFYRWLGIQEPASVLFSIGNGWVHYHYYRLLKRRIPSNYYLKTAILMYAMVGVNAWVWSTVFHCRDNAWTEKLDYFSAGLLILYSFYYAVRRIFYLKKTPWLLVTGCVICYLMHIMYLSFIRFDYDYNMISSVVVGVFQLVLWMGWSAWQYLRPQNEWTSRSGFAYMAFVSVVGVGAAMALELLDFPPHARLLDAHSFWHLSTIPLMVVWYRFVLADVKHEIKHYKSSVTAFSIPK
ncbi:Per1-like protein [Absidia repens]|uniref:Post-GPI attachment to proteins factor 3 n=1 Tax=Absidia repens TaxID=90262 RepID=A0A1X2IPY6_9FUNG|nr:Per1-like protein [Absidia repens]